MRKVIGETGSSLYTSAPCQDYRLSTPEKDNPYPDILGDNSDKYTGEVNINLNKNLGGSVDNINKSALYCTLPKKKSWRNAKYQSDSQSPLLPSSRYGSSGGDSYTSSRRLSDDTFRYPSINNNFRGNQRSCSYLNLVSTARPNPGTQNKNLDSTPLLDISGLESRFDREKILSPTNSSLVNSYDYHAAQLERFLEEYRTLQKELNKMKETCETICQGGEKNLSNSRFLDPLLHNNVLEDNPKSILKKSPPTTLSAGENSNFWSRNSQKRFEEVYYKS